MGTRSLPVVVVVLLAPVLLECGDRGATPTGALIEAVRREDGAAIGRMLGAGADARVGLEVAVLGDHCAAVETLLPAVPRPFVFADAELLLEALKTRRTTCVEAMLAAGVDLDAPDEWGVPLLHFAAADRQPEQLRLLLEAGADPAVTDTTGRTALMAAAAADRVRSVRRLVRSGADPDQRDDDGWTALMVALRHRRHAAARWLIDGGAEVDATSFLGWTPLLIAVREADLGGSELLLSHGADPNRSSRAGRSPLVLAAATGAVELVDVLLAAGADPASTAMDREPAWWAEATGSAEVAGRLSATVTGGDT